MSTEPSGRVSCRRYGGTYDLGVVHPTGDVSLSLIMSGSLHDLLFSSEGTKGGRGLMMFLRECLKSNDRFSYSIVDRDARVKKGLGRPHAMVLSEDRTDGDAKVRLVQHCNTFAIRRKRYTLFLEGLDDAVGVGRPLQRAIETAKDQALFFGRCAYVLLAIGEEDAAEFEVDDPWDEHEFAGKKPFGEVDEAVSMLKKRRRRSACDRNVCWKDVGEHE